jgi:hypothetical protein
MWDFLFFASPSSKNQKVLSLSSKKRQKKKKKKKKTRTYIKAYGNHQNACKLLNSKVFIQYGGKKINYIKNRKKNTEKRKEKKNLFRF